MNMEQLTAICINDKTERDRKIKVLGITEDKEYQVKPSKYANYYELENDLGNVETYFMDRFKVVEGDKMEDKTIKVRCIDAKENEKLEENKIYTVKKEYGSSYSLEEIKQHDYQFEKSRFEKVEDVLMVECIDNLSHLTKGKKYKVIESASNEYLIENDIGNKNNWYLKDLFKPVEPQKEVKEYTVMELLDFPVGTQFEDELGDIIEVSKVEEAENEKELRINGDMDCVLRLTTAWKRMKFIKIEQPKPVTTAEAFKALDEGKEIESLVTHDRYSLSKNGDEKTLMIKKMLEGRKIVNAAEQMEGLRTENNILKKEIEELKARNNTQNQSIKDMQKDIENYKETNKSLVEEIKNKNINYQVNIEELSKEIDQVMEEKEKLKESNFINYNEYKDHLKKKDEHIIDLNQLIEKKDIKIEELEKQIEELQKVNKEINDSRELMHEEILKLEKEIDDWNDLEAEKEKELAELKRELEKANDLNRNINNQNDRLRKEVEEGNEVLENEYHNKIFIAEQKINTLSTEVACLKAFKEKDNNLIQNLKEAIKKMAEVL